MRILCGAILAVAAVVPGRARRFVAVCNRCEKSMLETRTRGGFSAAVEDVVALADLGGLACSLQP